MPHLNNPRFLKPKDIQVEDPKCVNERQSVAKEMRSKTESKYWTRPTFKCLGLGYKSTITFDILKRPVCVIQLLFQLVFQDRASRTQHTSAFPAIVNCKLTINLICLKSLYVLVFLLLHPSAMFLQFQSPHALVISQQNISESNDLFLGPRSYTLKTLAHILPASTQ